MKYIINSSIDISDSAHARLNMSLRLLLSLFAISDNFNSKYLDTFLLLSSDIADNNSNLRFVLLNLKSDMAFLNLCITFTRLNCRSSSFFLRIFPTNFNIFSLTSSDILPSLDFMFTDRGEPPLYSTAAASLGQIARRSCPLPNTQPHLEPHIAREKATPQRAPKKRTPR